VSDLLEKDLDRQLFETKRGLAYSTGWKLVYHTYRSKKSPSGFPDRVLARDRIIFAELKTATGRLSDSQEEWLEALARAGGEVYLWRPDDLDEIAKVLASRWTFLGWRPGRIPHLTKADSFPWTPASIWVPGVGRADKAGLHGVGR
jgi:hypothetical protein